MWISEKLRQESTGEATTADLGVTTIGGESVGAYTRGETRDLGICTPQGVSWRPKTGARVLVLKGGPEGEEAYVLGVEDAGRAKLADGELMLHSEGASICLRNNGRVEISGQLIINGEAYKPCTCPKKGGGF